MSKLEIILNINNLKRNKYKYIDREKYYNEINLLYKKLSYVNNIVYKSNKQKVENKIIYEDELSINDKQKLQKVINDIMNFGSLSYLLENQNVKLLSHDFKLFDLFLIENNLINYNSNIKYTIQTKSIIGNYDKNELMNKIKLLLKLCNIVISKYNKIIISLIMYDLIISNIKFCLDNIKFAESIRNKLKEFEVDNNSFNYITNKYNLGENIIYKWIEVINTTIFLKK